MAEEQQSGTGKKILKTIGNLIDDVVKNEKAEVEFNLDDWITDFEQGFPRFEKLNPLYKANYWGQGFENRPRIKELNEEADAQSVEGYRLIEFFPDRENKYESYLLFGTPLTLMEQCSSIMAQRQMIASIELPISEELHTQPEFNGKILISLIFDGQKSAGGRAVRRNSLRLVNDDYKTITLERVQEYARRIISKFNGNWVINLGKEGYSYVNWRQGVQLQQMYCLSIDDAKRIVESILDITGQTPEWRLLKKDSSVEPESAYRETTGKTVIAGKTVDELQRRPYGVVKWVRASIRFPESVKTKTLCNRAGYIMPSLDWLERPSGGNPLPNYQRTSPTNTASGSAVP